MSTTAMTAVFKNSASKGSARLVLLAMADEANDQGLLTAYRRSQTWLGRKANVDTGTVRRAIDALEKLGELKVLALGDGRASSNYQLLLDGLEPIEGVQPAPPGPAKRAPSPGEVQGQARQDAPPIIPVLPGVDPGTSPTSAAAAASASFAAFWKLYPRGDGKPAATKAWDKALKAAPPERIMQGLELWLAYWKARNEPEYVPWAQKWLNQQQWFATPPPVKAAPPGPRGRVDDDRGGAAGRVVDL